MNIINETTYDLVKLKYILFNKFDRRVFYKVLKMDKAGLRAIDIGFIHSNSKIEKIDFSASFEAANLNSSTHFTSDSKIYDLVYDLNFNVKISNDDDDCKIVSYMRFTQIEDLKFGDKRDKTNFFINQKDANIPLDKDELYFVIIYPNNQIPAMIRVYDKNDFNLLNIDDKKAIYNSYFENVNVEKTIETQILEKLVKNVSILKMEEDENIQSYLRMLSNESFDPETETYHNDELNLTVDEHENLIIDGVNLTQDARDFDFNSIEQAEKTCEFEYLDQLKEMVNEIIGSNNFKDPAPLDLKWKEKNGTFIFKINHFETLVFVIAKSKYALIVPVYQGSYCRSEIILANLENESILLSTSQEQEYGSSFRYIKCSNGQLVFNYQLKVDEPTQPIANPIYEINKINKDICGLTTNKVQLYSDNFVTYFNNDDELTILKSPISNLLTGEDDNGKYLLVRGVFGNLMKRYC